MRLAQKEPGPIAEAGSRFHTAGEDGFGDHTVFARTSDLPDQLDAHACEHVALAVDQGYMAEAAAEAWLDYVQVQAEAAADMAIAEVAWEVSE